VPRRPARLVPIALATPVPVPLAALVAVLLLAVLVQPGGAGAASAGLDGTSPAAASPVATAPDAPAVTLSPKPPLAVVPPAPAPAVIRQGGDTIADPVAIAALPYSGSGTTVGYTDDYDEICPYGESISPDVVYTFTGPAWANALDIDMCGSAYDTKIYVYDAGLELVGCNDDYYFDEFCGMWVSRLEFLPVVPGETYYLVIDGYGGASGEYELSIDVWPIETVGCPYGSQLKGEPELVDGYLDAHNGGCNSLGDLGWAPFQELTGTSFCGVAGWYTGSGGGDVRDTDWFTITLPATGEVTITADADLPSLLFHLGPPDCDQVAVLQSVEFGPFWQQELTIAGPPGTEVWAWVGSTVFTAPPGFGNEYAYVLWLDLPVATRTLTFSEVKALYAE